MADIDRFGNRCRDVTFAPKILWCAYGHLGYFPAVGKKGVQNAIEKLSAAQVETLRHVYAHQNSKEIARMMGVSPHTVDARIKAAIRILGVSTRIEAARIVHDASDPAAYQPLVYQPPELAYPPQAAETDRAQSEKRQPSIFSIGYPFPTKGRPFNTHGRRERILWPILIAFGTIMAFAALYTVLLGLGAMLA
jgi:DNA-binding CsgD family transcriptional regulator